MELKGRAKSLEMQRLTVDAAQKLHEANGEIRKLKRTELAALLVKSSTAGVKGTEKLDSLRDHYAKATEHRDWKQLVSAFYRPPPQPSAGPTQARTPEPAQVLPNQPVIEQRPKRMRMSKDAQG